MIEPFPAFCGSVEPQYGSRVSSNRKIASTVVLPISKHFLVLLR
jgi:hypothetical protein